jgi:hypothetical protein
MSLKSLLREKEGNITKAKMFILNEKFLQHLVADQLQPHDHHALSFQVLVLNQDSYFKSKEEGN